MPKPDYRYMDYPYDSDGFPYFAEDECEGPRNPNTDKSPDDYTHWLSEYLRTIDAALTPEQLAWYNKHKSGSAPVAVLGADLGTQHAVDDLGYDANVDSQELCEWPHDVAPTVDVGYRVLLAHLLRDVEDSSKREHQLRQFFGCYNDYSNK